MTDEELAELALGMVIDDINDTIHDEVGLSEQLDDQLDGLDEAGQQEMVDRLAAALRAIRDGLASPATVEGPSMYQQVYWEAEKALDEILGPNEEDGAGEGLVAEIWLIAEQRDEARAELARLRGDAPTTLPAAPAGGARGGWTSHGHWYGPGGPDPATEPAMKARCGGPGLCSKCSGEAARGAQ